MKAKKHFTLSANTTVKKRIRITAIICMVFSLGLVACTDAGNDVSNIKSKTTGKTGILTTYSSLSPDTTDTYANTTLNDQSDTTLKNELITTTSGKKITPQSDSTTKPPSKNTTTTKAKATTTAAQPTTTRDPKPIEIEIANYFPELPGYTTEYEISMFIDGKARSKGEYRLNVVPSELTVKDNIVLATDQQKKKYDIFTVTATDNQTGRKAQLTITPKKWNVNFEDNFTGTSINSDIWSNFEYQYSNASVKDGALTILAERLNMGGQIVYTSSGIRTRSKYSLKTGCFMARMQSPDRGGCNSAFWLMPEGRYTRDFFFMDTEFTNVGCSEIDIVEYSAFYKKEFPITQHFWDGNGSNHRSRQYWGVIDDLIYEGYHDYACIWEDDGVYYYMDGKPVAANRYVNTHEGAVSAYIVLSTNSAKIHAGLEWLGPCTDDMFPFATSFDWVKTYY